MEENTGVKIKRPEVSFALPVNVIETSTAWKLSTLKLSNDSLFFLTMQKFKRLKKRRQEDEEERPSGSSRHDSLHKIFDDDDDEDMGDGQGGYEDEMDTFIDDDEEEDEDAVDNRRDRREKAPVKPRARRAPIEGLSEE